MNRPERDLESELREVRLTVRALRGELARVADETRRERARAYEADAKAARAIAHLRAIRTSRSWRITAPIRSLKRRIGDG